MCVTDIRMDSRELAYLVFINQIAYNKNMLEELAKLFQRGKLNGQRPLFVEDIDLNREIASEILREAGFIIEKAENDRVAVDFLVEKGSGYYSIVLMDIQMPVMDVYTAAKKIRALEEPELANIPIVAMTADAFEEDKRKTPKVVMNAHVSKPIKVKNLFDILEEIL